MTMTASDRRAIVATARLRLVAIAADLECSLGVDPALPVTMHVLAAVDAADTVLREERVPEGENIQRDEERACD